jgi:outer membrane protein W
VSAVCAGILAQSALADYKAGDVIVRIGASFVDPDDDNIVSRTIPFTVVEDVEVDPEILNVDAVLSLDYDDDTTWYIGGVWLFADHWGLELQYIGNASHEADLNASAFAGNVLLDNSTLAGGLGDFEADITSLMIDWYPLDPSCLVQPYVGLGVNYTDIDSDNDFKQIRSVFGSGDTFADGRLGLGSDFSWVAQVGVDFVLGRDSNWIINAAAMYVDAEPDLELGFNLLADVPAPFDSPASLPVRVRGDFDYSPWVFNLGIGYKFSF